MYDFIGDVHGHADELEELLCKLGYNKKAGSYSHESRKVFFVGDYVDRGPQIRETLEIVKSMVDHGNAIALLGNHEYNTLCFHFTETEGGHLRKHLIKNIIQHYQTLKQFQNRQKEYEGYLDWFKTLPAFYETEKFRAVHACWDAASISYLKKHLSENRFTDNLIYQSAKRETPLHHAIEITLKGKEIKMPDGLSFKDKDGNIRTDIRIKWWENPTTANYKEISIEPLENLPDSPVMMDSVTSTEFYQPDDKPVFFGHYWLKGNPMLYKNNICCLDYSVAKHGYLAAYRFDGESILSVDKFVYVKSKC
jgi:hypothetical protein